MLKDTTTRMNNAYDAFEALLIDIASISREDAKKVIKFYAKNKMTKLEVNIGRVSVKHGAFLDKEIILRALAAA